MAEKGVKMEVNIKKHHLSRILIFFIILLFAVSLTMNVLFCSNYNPYYPLDKTTVIETWTISENIVSNENGDDSTTKNIYPVSMIAAIPKEFSLLLFLIIFFRFYFSTSFIILPDEWTLINRKIRLDD